MNIRKNIIKISKGTEIYEFILKYLNQNMSS